MRKTFPFSTLLNLACHYSFTILSESSGFEYIAVKKIHLTFITYTNAVHKLNIITISQRSKLSSLSEATAEKLQQNKLNNNNRPIFIDDNDDDFEGSGRKGEVSFFSIFIYFERQKSFGLMQKRMKGKKYALLFHTNSTHINFNWASHDVPFKYCWRHFIAFAEKNVRWNFFNWLSFMWNLKFMIIFKISFKIFGIKNTLKNRSFCVYNVGFLFTLANNLLFHQNTALIRQTINIQFSSSRH